MLRSFRRARQPSATGRAATRAGTARRPHSRGPLVVESLEPRLTMSANVVVGAEGGRGSQPLVQLLDVSTGTVVAETLAFESGFAGGVRVAMGDVDGNGDQEVIAGSGEGRVAEIRVFDIRVSGGRTTLAELPAYRVQPFGAGYTRGVTVASGDIDGNGRYDIIASMSRGRGVVNAFLSVAPQAPANDPLQNAPCLSITPAAAGFDGGSAVAVGDFGTFVAGKLQMPGVPDGKVEIVVASGVDAPPKVEVYDVSVRSAPRVVTTLHPFSPSVRWGLTVSTGRCSNDAIDDIIVSAGRHAGMKSVIYDGTPGSSTILGDLTPGGTPARPNAPAYAAPVDVNGDGKIDVILVTQGDPGGTTALFNTRIGNASPATTVKLPNIPGGLRIAAPRTTFKQETLGSGLKQQDIILGSGASPVLKQQILVRYTGFFADGRVFETTGNAVMSLNFGQGVPGFIQGLATMKEGGVRLLKLPANLAFGAEGLKKKDADGKPVLGTDGKPVYIIPPNTPLNYLVELVTVLPVKPA